MTRFASIGTALLAIVVSFAGCTRSRYRQRADIDTSRVLNEKAACESLPLRHFNVYPDARSRFHDPTCVDQPRLPIPAPALNNYQLPFLETGQPAPPELASPAGEDVVGMPHIPSGMGEQRPGEDTSVVAVTPILSEGMWDRPENQSLGRIQLASAIQLQLEPPAASETQGTPELLPPPNEETAEAKDVNDLNEDEEVESNGAIRIAPIPTDAWESLPSSCLNRMLEFESLQKEYARSFERDVTLADLDDSPRLSLANLMELTYINSREYQTRKEILYRVALRLTRERYRFELQPVPFGNGTDVNYRHLRVRGSTVNSLGIPTRYGVQKTLSTGGQFLARFANDVVLTFNGPQGFSANIGSELLFDIQQSVFQRDIRFETLTQTERDVVYAARDFIRFRKQLFRDLAIRYYNLIFAYRRVEIDSQDYFTNLRAFLQGQAEYRQADRLPRIQVDQFEQTALRSRSRLVSRCNSLETSLDTLKLRIGLPPEMPVNLDLTELRVLTLRDETTVARELIRRTQNEVGLQIDDQDADPAVLVNGAGVLADRVQEILVLRKKLIASNGEDSMAASDASADDLTRISAMLRLQEIRLDVDFKREVLQKERAAKPAAPPFRIFLRTIDLIESQLQLIERAEDVKALANSASDPREASRRSEHDAVIPGDVVDLRGERVPTSSNNSNAAFCYFSAPLQLTPKAADDTQAISDALKDLDDQLAKTVEERKLSELPNLVERANALLERADQSAANASKGLLPGNRTQLEATIRELVDQSVQLSNGILSGNAAGIQPIEADENETMVTALVARLDLMNQRGDLADAWRQIKLAGDDLRSIVDLQATQIIRTRSDVNRPFDFTFDDSETRLGLSFDTPLNRRIQRNNYRLALIDYNAALRNMINAEDQIKFDIRQDLRQLALDRNQYDISIAGAALAYERVVSTKLQLKLAVQKVVARDFLEAQQDYTAALSSVAEQHIAYLLDRIELFFDIEGIDVDDNGFWQGVRDESLQPPVNLNFPATNPRPYGRLSCEPCYSPTIRHIERTPPGEVLVVEPPVKLQHATDRH